MVGDIIKSAAKRQAEEVEEICRQALANDSFAQAYAAKRFMLVSDMFSEHWNTKIHRITLSFWERLALAWKLIREGK